MINQQKKYKPEFIRISLSTTFLIKTRCKKCCGLPTFYYYLRKSQLLISPNRSIKSYWTEFRKHLEYYLEDNPSYLNDIGPLKAGVYMTYNAKLHKNRGADNRNNYTEFLSCDCGSTTWSFSDDRSIKNRPESLHRKAKNKYPQKFDF